MMAQQAGPPVVVATAIPVSQAQPYAATVQVAKTVRSLCTTRPCETRMTV
jgi:hypothetical protein